MAREGTLHVQGVLLGILARYREQAADRHAKSSSHAIKAGDRSSISSQGGTRDQRSSSCWPVSGPGLGDRHRHAHGDSIIEEYQQGVMHDKLVKGWMGERISRLEALLTAQRHTLRETQHMSLTLEKRVGDLAEEGQAGMGSYVAGLHEQVAALRRACVVMQESNTDLSHDLRREEAHREAAAEQWAELVREHDSTLIQQLGAKDARIESLEARLRLPAGVRDGDEISKLRHTVEVMTEWHVRSRETIGALNARLENASHVKAQTSARIQELEVNLVREGKMLDQEREKIFELEARMHLLMGPHAQPMPKAAAGANDDSHGRRREEDLQRQLTELQEIVEGDVEMHRASTEDLVAQQWRAIRELQVELQVIALSLLVFFSILSVFGVCRYAVYFCVSLQYLLWLFSLRVVLL